MISIKSLRSRLKIQGIMPSLNCSRGKLITIIPSHSQERVYTWRVVVRQIWEQLDSLLDRTFAKWWILVRTESESGNIKVLANKPIIRPSGTCDPIRDADNEHSWRDKFLKGDWNHLAIFRGTCSCRLSRSTAQPSFTFLLLATVPDLRWFDSLLTSNSDCPPTSHTWSDT